MSKWGRRPVAFLLAVLLCLSAALGLAEGVLTLPAAVKSIEAEAFAGAQGFSEVVLPEGVETIGSRAFADSTIERINLPQSVTSIADDAFEGSDVLATVTEDSYAHTWCTEQGVRVKVILEETAASSFAYAIADGAATITDFTGSETEVVVPAQIEGYPVTAIAKYAFEQKAVTSVVLPDTVTAIEAAAFYWSESLQAITIPASVASIGESAFFRCHTDLKITGAAGSAAQTHAWANAIGFVDEATGETLFDNDFAYTLENGAATITIYTGDDAQLTVPAQIDGYTVSAVSAGALQQCDTLTHVTIEAQITKLDVAIFMNCDSLTEVVLPESVTEIALIAFKGCYALERVYIPASVTLIDDSAFDGCSNVTIHGYAGSYAETFAGENGIAFVALDDAQEPEGEQTEGSYTYVVTDGAATVTKYAGGDVEVAIPSSLGGYPVTAIGASAFAGDTVLMDVTIPEGVTAIGDYAFTGCTALNGVHLPVSLQTIGAHAFDGCSNLNFVEFEKNVSSVGEDAFANCGEYIFFRAYVGTAPADYADAHGIFYEYNYDELYDGDYVYNVIGGEAAVVDYIGSEAALAIPAQLGEYKVTMIAPEAFANREDIASVLIPEGVTLIATNAFAYCPNLASVTLPSTIIEFYGSAFSGTAIAEIVLPENMAYIGFYAFEGCAQLEKATVLSKDVEFDGDVFTNCGEGLTIYGYADSTAQTFAQENGYAFVALDGEATPSEPEEETTPGEATPSEPEDPAIEETPAVSFTYTIADGVVTITDFTGSETDVVIPKAIEDCPVTTIGNSAFAGKGVKTIVLQDSVTTLAGFNFTWCWRLESITIPATVTEIGDCPFLQSSSGLVVIGEAGSAAEAAAQKYAVDFQNQQTGEVTLNGDYGYEIANGEATLTAYSGTETVLALPSTLGGCPVTAIGWHALINDTDVTSITIPEGVTSIDYGAMQYDSALTEVVLPESLTSLGGYAFYACSALEKITIPAGVTDIGSNVFEGVAEGFAIYGYTGSAAETYASENGHAFVAVDAEQEIEGEFTDGDWTYVVADGEVTVTGYSGTASAVYVGELLEGFPTVAIGEGVFQSKTELVEVSLPESIRTIGANAFTGCSSLTAINLPDSITEIGEEAFYQCTALEAITLPEGLTAIGVRTFASCTSLKSIAIPEGVTQISMLAFNSCYSLESVTLPESLTEIGHTAFRYCGLTEIEIPDGVTLIDSNMFDRCSALAKVTLPANLTAINANAFRDCTALTSIDLPVSLTSIGQNAFSGSGLTMIDIPGNVTSIGDYAFQGCTALRDIAIPDGVRQIGAYIAEGCTSLESIYLLEGVETIGAGAFQNCTAMKSAMIPQSVTGIGELAFDNVNAAFAISGYEGSYAQTYASENGFTFVALGRGENSSTDFEYAVADDEVVIYGYTGSAADVVVPYVIGGYQVTSIGDAAFQNNTTLTSVDLPESVTHIGTMAFADCTNLMTVSLPGEMDAINDYAFEGCTNLQTITLPKGIQAITENMFSECTSLTEIVIPEGVLSVELSAFYGCTSLASVSLPEGLKYIGNWAFNGCSGLTQITIPETVQTIGELAFYGTGLTEFTIPNAVTTLGKNAFMGSNSLKTITILGDLECIDENTFYWCSGLETVNITGSVKAIAAQAFYCCENLKSVTLPDSITSIGDEAFRQCRSMTLTNNTLPASLQTIGYASFYLCEGLTEITVPDGVTSIGASAFQGCTNLTKITIPAGVTDIGSNAFEGVAEGFAIYGYTGSAAETYATENSIAFVAL